MTSIKNRVARLEEVVARDPVGQLEPLLIVHTILGAATEQAAPIVGLRQLRGEISVTLGPGETYEQMRDRFVALWKEATPNPRGAVAAVAVYPEDADSALQ
jgi:hypothetical protein